MIESPFLKKIADVVGCEYLWTGEKIDPAYFKDHSLHSPCHFDVLVKPASPEEISAIFRLCNEYNRPVTPRGGGTGVTGGALAVNKGVLLSIERLNRIISIDANNRYAFIESGVITETFCSEVESKGMYFPVTPGSRGTSFLGGNIAENCGSPASCKYGTIKNFVLNLEVVLPTGEIIWTGSNVYKDATGLNLTQLFVGSEGVLGIITKAVLRVLPKPGGSTVILAGFRELKDACQASLRISRFSSSPVAVELITRAVIDLTLPSLSIKYPLVSPDVQAQLLIEWERYPELDVDAVLEECCTVLEGYSPVGMLVGTTSQEKELLWGLRQNIGWAMTSNGCRYRDVDVCVPPASLYEFLMAVGSIEDKYGRELMSFGHSMDGNLHTMLLFRPGTDPAGSQEDRELLAEIYRTAISFGGTISGEHGVGCLQQEFLPLQLSKKSLELMKAIKAVFDPNHILNPGKLLLDRDIII